MENFKGTPGPWVASKSDRSIGPVIRDDDQSYGMILPVAWVEFDGKPGHHQSNANLIAAAPELLEALQNLKREVVLSDIDLAYIESHFRPHIDRARAAIAKALGQ